MDFDLSEDQQAIADLAARILDERLPPEELRRREAAGEWFAADVWEELARAGLLALALPEAHGGAGLGLVEACLVAEAMGRAAAPLPYVPVLAAALALARFGRADQQARLLPPLASGGPPPVAALHEPVEVAVPLIPSTVATADGDGWALHGEKVAVSLGPEAAALVVPARTGEAATAVFVVAPDAPGLALEPQRAMTGEPQWTVRFDGTPVGPADVLGDVHRGEAVVAHLEAWAIAVGCAFQTGVCEGALALTARYVSEREQFGVRLGTFQAVAHRVADAYVDTEGVRLTGRQAAWRLDAGLDATTELMTAAFWAAEGAQRVVHAAQHLHGGIGMDLDYPVHRYFRWAKVLELQLGGATPSLRRLGAALVGAGRR